MYSIVCQLNLKNIYGLKQRSTTKYLKCDVVIVNAVTIKLLQIRGVNPELDILENRFNHETFNNFDSEDAG